ncbi:MAG: hypothetical protein CMF61_02575 [Magnetococcales bacterium]|nr:hypothetical protein [Magnetococcales bacterium]
MQDTKIPDGAALMRKLIKGPLKDFEIWVDNALAGIHSDLCAQIEELQQTMIDGGSVELGGFDDVFSCAEIVPQQFITQGADKYINHILSVMKLKKHFTQAGYNIDVAIKKNRVITGHSLRVKVTFKDDYSNEYIL